MLTPTMPTAPSQVAEIQLPLTTATCADNLTYLEDLSLPEGTVVQPGASLDKRWLVKNSGTCNWDERYRLKLVSGAELNASIDQALYPARSGAKATIQIVFTAAYTPGTYQNAWQAFDPQGQPFGDPISLRVVVNSDQP